MTAMYCGDPTCDICKAAGIAPKPSLAELNDRWREALDQYTRLATQRMFELIPTPQKAEDYRVVVDRCACAERPYGQSQWCAFCIRTGKDKELARKVAEMNSRAFHATVKRYSDYEAERIAAANVAAIYACQSAWRPLGEDLPPAKPQQPSKPADPRAEGIARAIAGMNSHEPRLGSSKWSPE